MNNSAGLIGRPLGCHLLFLLTELKASNSQHVIKAHEAPWPLPIIPAMAKAPPCPLGSADLLIRWRGGGSGTAR
eukprot:3499374-Karenia_brevis.AAC.1